MDPVERIDVTNDTGPMHVAAALGRPVIALFGPTDPRRTGPYGQAANVLQLHEMSCVPCLKSSCASTAGSRWRVCAGSRPQLLAQARQRLKL